MRVLGNKEGRGGEGEDADGVTAVLVHEGSVGRLLLAQAGGETDTRLTWKGEKPGHWLKNT